MAYLNAETDLKGVTKFPIENCKKRRNCNGDGISRVSSEPAATSSFVHFAFL